MHFRQVALLGILLLLSSSFSIGKEEASGQSVQVDDARSSLVQAFMLVQQADLQGASPSQISQLANNLNLALYYEENATLLFAKNMTASNLYASKSVNLSNSTSFQALSISSAARTQVFFGQVVAYSIAIAAGFSSALLLVEFHRLHDYVRRLRSRQMQLDSGVDQYAT
jgi:hypothetical protein